MSTVDKALTLLDAISRMDREAGLSEIAKHCALDKATARRFLVDLERHGFVEQDPQTRRYRIGSSPVRLARIREAHFPLLSIAMPFMRELADASGETVHLSQFVTGRLSTMHVEDSAHAHRVIVDIGSTLPLHATASGHAFLAYCPAAQIEEALSGSLEAFTPYTMTAKTDIKRRLEETARRGYSINEQGFESGVISTAAPIRAPNCTPIGTIAVAAPLARTDAATIRRFGLTTAAIASRICGKLFGLEQTTIKPLARRIG